MVEHHSLPSRQNKSSKMKLVIVALALVAAAVAIPVDDKKVPQIVRSEFEKKPEGGYNFNFETENGITVQETGEIKEAVDEENKPHQVVVVRGEYGYTDPEGNNQKISYTADELGFHPVGDSIPKEPAH